MHRVKYKVEKYGQYLNADLYQMSAYCRMFRLGEWWLMYAEGDSDVQQIELVDGPGIEHYALDLSRSTAALAGRPFSFVGRTLLARRLCRSARSRRRLQPH